MFHPSGCDNSSILSFQICLTISLECRKMDQLVHQGPLHPQDPKNAIQ